MHVVASSVILSVVLVEPGEGSIDHHITFSNKKMSTIENNYTTTEREGSAMVYALLKFRDYLLRAHFKMNTNHSSLKYLVNKLVLGGEIFWWLILFLKFDLEVMVKPDRLNSVPDYLSRIESGDESGNLDNSLPDMQLFVITVFNYKYIDII